MDSYYDNSAFINSLNNNTGNARNYGKFNIGIAIGIGILMLIGCGILAYQNIQLRNRIKFANLHLPNKPVNQTND